MRGRRETQRVTPTSVVQRHRGGGVRFDAISGRRLRTEGRKGRIDSGGGGAGRTLRSQPLQRRRSEGARNSYCVIFGRLTLAAEVRCTTPFVRDGESNCPCLSFVGPETLWRRCWWCGSSARDRRNAKKMRPDRHHRGSTADTRGFGVGKATKPQRGGGQRRLRRRRRTAAARQRVEIANAIVRAFTPAALPPCQPRSSPFQLATSPRHS